MNGRGNSILVKTIEERSNRGPVPRVLWHSWFPRNRWPSIWDRDRSRPLAATRGTGSGPPLCPSLGRPLFALHRVGFALPCLLPAKRWALTPPFHPCLWPCGPSAVSSLLHFPSRCRAQPLAGTLPYGARKFLQACAQRPPGPRLVRSRFRCRHRRWGQRYTLATPESSIPIRSSIRRRRVESATEIVVPAPHAAGRAPDA
jgi:hypothetical protein